MQAHATFSTVVGRAVTLPSVRAIGQRYPLDIVASILLAAALFTVSWERFANLDAAGYNVKLPVVLFSITALLSIPRWWRWLRAIRSRPVTIQWLVSLALVVVVVFLIRAFTAFPLALGIAQVVAIGTGAVAPALSIIGRIAGLADVLWALRWFVAGAVVSSLFGLYQLFAFYAGLPQGVDYTGVGTSGEGGRISAFSYEPAYFAYFIVLSIGAVIAAAQMSKKRVPWLAIVFFALVLVLVNVRALLFLLPLFAVLLAVEWRRNRGLILRGAISGVVLVAVVTAVPYVITAAMGSAPTPVQSASTGSARQPSAQRSSDAESALPPPPQLPTNVLDPNEPSSNGPRVDLYKAVGVVDIQHPLIGVGPGHLRDALAANRFVASNQQGATVVANNIWLQAVADGGVVLLLLEGALISTLVVLWWRGRRTATHPIVSALLALLLVGGMLTSYFFDIKVWVVIALAVVLAVAVQDRDGAATASS